MMSVREFVPATCQADLAALTPAFLRIWNAPQNLPFLSFSLRPFEEAQVRGWFETHLESGGRYFAAVSGEGQVLGVAVVRVDPIAAFELFALGVQPESQGRGVGRLLTSHVLGVARSLGFGCVEASVFADNARMLRLLLSLGFLPVRMEHHRRCDGADLVILAHRLTSSPLPASSSAAC